MNKQLDSHPEYNGLDGAFVRGTSVFRKVSLTALTPKLVLPRSRKRIAVHFYCSDTDNVTVSNNSDADLTAGMPVNQFISQGVTQRTHGDYATNEFWAICPMDTTLLVVEVMGECQCATGHGG